MRDSSPARSESCTASVRLLNATMRRGCPPLRRRPSTRRTRRWRGPCWAMSRLSRGTKRPSCKGESLLQWFTPSSLRACCGQTDTSANAPSTLENAYSKIIASLVNEQQEHLNLADSLSVQVVGVLVSLARKNEGHRKKASRVYFYTADLCHLI